MDFKDAVRNAIAFATASLGPGRTTDLRLEEIESSTVGESAVWLITLSTASPPEGNLSALRLMMGADPGREYKVFAVSKETGEVLSMKIRLLAAPAM
jgi:hypothetical protein